MKKNDSKHPTQDAPKPCAKRNRGKNNKSLPPRKYPDRNDGLLPKNRGRDSDK